MTTSPEVLFNIVKENLEKHEYRGIDPYDFFESKCVPKFFFNEQIGSKFTFLNKISPVNFRQFLAIGRNYNSKAMALILSAYLNCTHNFDDEVPFIVDRIWPRAIIPLLCPEIAENFSNPFDVFPVVCNFI